MSGGLPVLDLTEDDLRLMLVAGVFLGETTLNFQMSGYVYGRSKEGNHIIRLNKTWEKILLAARAIAAVDNPQDVCAIGCKPSTQRAVLKFAHYARASAIAGRFTPGAFTNQKQSCFREPRLLVVSDPRSDHQPVNEASCVNIPVIAFCTTDTPINRVDIVIPCNNKSSQSVAVVWWLLAREVRRMRGEDIRSQPWNVMVDLFLYRDPSEEEQEVPEEVDEAVMQPALGGAELDNADNWVADPSMPVGGLGEMGIPATGFGATDVVQTGGWSNLDADPMARW
ncbi:40S ribosomal protein SA [Fasciola gigantica]|uniref:Small ribosomal subunit protein uS2 n=1 Tax=Fasciola gigantica TaxID=46835 RepID=A0A504YR12_FASGI|nr:40S ribosomal protein SA [Fasciola gigantica]